MLSTVLDVFRLRQYFNAITMTREVADGVRADLGFVGTVRRGLVPLPADPAPPPGNPFPPFQPQALERYQGRRVGVAATGGSGALASVVGVARALEESGIRPAVYSMCSGSSLFGFPLAAGIPAAEVAAFTVRLRAEDYVDPQWAKLLSLPLTLGRGFAGLLRGERVEATYRRLLGDRTLGELEVPCYAPIWNIEENRVEYLGPRTHPDVSVARAVRMAIALPLFLEPVELDGRSWSDGGIVDIFPVHPVLDLEERCDVVVGINGFYPPGFVGEDASGWHERRFSILHVASQVRTSQQVELARENLGRLRRETELIMIEPVPYETVRGVGFYEQFLDTSEWPGFMRAGREHALAGLRSALAIEEVAADLAS
ncbi:MAG: patatin-like phospholipase family protein [Acidimicrobiales bacterium]|nr:patatin-like phospholipase family protein [Acidimicrobiales bacterium]